MAVLRRLCTSIYIQWQLHEISADGLTVLCSSNSQQSNIIVMKKQNIPRPN
jgi:hypothetical protein